jgi:hypothetical protein
MLILNGLIDKLQETFPPNRVVALLTPLAFAPAAGYVTVQVARFLPGAFTASQLTAVFIAGALIAFGKAYKWLDGWQKHEQAKADIQIYAPPQPPTQNTG